jgi:hypothetical protein
MVDVVVGGMVVVVGTFEVVEVVEATSPTLQEARRSVARAKRDSREREGKMGSCWEWPDQPKATVARFSG